MTQLVYRRAAAAVCRRQGRWCGSARQVSTEDRSAQTGHVPSELTLLNYDAPIDMQDKNGCSSLLDACLCTRVNVVDVFIARGAVSQLLLKKGAQVHAVNKLGHTSLIAACTRANFEMVKFLIIQEAALYHQDSVGATTLLNACSMKQQSIVNLLLSAGSNTHLRNLRNEWTLFHTVDLATAQLLSYGVSVNDKDRGMTPLMNACARQHKQLVELSYSQTSFDFKLNTLKIYILTSQNANCVLASATNLCHS